MERAFFHRLAGTQWTCLAAAGARPIAAAVLLFPITAQAQELPASLADLLREAHGAERDTIEDIAKRLYPKSRAEIDALIDDIEDEEEARVSQSRFLTNWTGEGAVGANLSTGNTEEWSANASVKLTREGPQWEHKFEFGMEIREVDSERTEESIEAAYRARRDFGDSPIFAFGSFDYERKPFQGIDRRFTEGFGIGYQLVDTDDIDWEVSAGPALRQTRFVEGGDEDRLGGFLATEFEWDITDTLTLAENAGLVIDEANSSFSTTTSLTSELYGDLSARVSFTATYEADPPPEKVKWDTATRFTLVYDF